MPAFDYIALSRTYGVSDDDLKEANKVFDEIEKSKKDIPEIFQKEKIIEIIK